MLRSAAVLALVGTASAAYLSTDESCETFGLSLSCGMAEDESSCATGCEWVAGDADSDNFDYQEDRCAVPSADNEALYASMMTGLEALAPAIVTCAVFDEDDCTGSCGWGSLPFGGDYDYDERRRVLRRVLLEHGDYEGEMCLPSNGKAQQVLIADGADPFTKGYLSWVFNAGVTCPAETDETKCNALEGCLYGESDYGEDGVESCHAPPLAAMLMVNNKCSGSVSDELVAMANAEAEDGDDAVTIDMLYTAYGVTDQTDTSKLAALADAKIAAAEEKTAAAEVAYAALVAASENLTEDEAEEVEVLAEAASKGLPVKKIIATILAADSATACSSAFTKMGLTSDDGTCTAAAARRRHLLASYSTKVLINPTKVDDEAATAAVAALKADLGDAAVADSDVNAVSEMETIDNLDTTSLASFKTAADEAAVANVEAEAYEAEVEAESAASSVAAVSAIATAALAAAACVFA